jgi:hypothetical protein
MITISIRIIVRIIISPVSYMGVTMIIEVRVINICIIIGGIIVVRIIPI